MRLSSNQFAVPVRWLALGALLGGLVATLSWSSSLGQPATPSPGTPFALSATPVSPASMGRLVPHADDWTVIVTDAATAPTIDRQTANGTYVRIELTLTNMADVRRQFPFSGLLLRDEEERVYEPDLVASAYAGSRWTLQLPPDAPTETAIVFDVPPDAGDSFVLESHADPSFQVKVIALDPVVIVAPTPTPTAMGEPVTVAAEWAVIVTSATITPRIDQQVAVGIYVRIELTLTNMADVRRQFPFSGLLLRDEEERVYEPDLVASAYAGSRWTLQLPPDAPTETAIVFDVPPDAGDSFVLESHADPQFRVHIELERRG